MIEFILKISPIIFLGIIGFTLKSAGFFNKSHGDIFLKTVFYIAVPGLIFSSFDKLEFEYELIYLPFFAAFTLILNFGISLFIGKTLKLPKKTFGTFVLGSSIMNTGFVLPFIIILFGDTGVGRWMMFDLGNIGLVLTLIYYFACKMGSNQYSTKTVFVKLASSTPLIALLIALSLNLSGNHLPVFVLKLSKMTGILVIPLIMLALGIYFNPKLINFKLILIVIAIRMGIGLCSGMFLCYLFNFQGLERIIIITGASAPIGFNTLTFASLENLDKEFAASLVSLAIGIGIFSVPIILYIFSN